MPIMLSFAPQCVQGQKKNKSLDGRNGRAVLFENFKRLKAVKQVPAKVLRYDNEALWKYVALLRFQGCRVYLEPFVGKER
jgi:hypothetical protein